MASSFPRGAGTLGPGSQALAKPSRPRTPGAFRTHDSVGWGVVAESQHPKLLAALGITSLYPHAKSLPPFQAVPRSFFVKVVKEVQKGGLESLDFASKFSSELEFVHEWGPLPYMLSKLDQSLTLRVVPKHYQKCSLSTETGVAPEHVHTGYGPNIPPALKSSSQILAQWLGSGSMTYLRLQFVNCYEDSVRALRNPAIGLCWAEIYQLCQGWRRYLYPMSAEPTPWLPVLGGTLCFHPLCFVLPPVKEETNEQIQET